MWILLCWIIFSFCVAILADKRGRSGGGFFFLAILLSPLVAGVIILCMDDLRAAKERSKSDYVMQMQMRAQQQQLEELRRMQTSDPTGRALPPLGARDLINVSRNGEDLGSLSVAEVRRMLDDGRLSLEDYYYDTSCSDWIELAGHPTLNPA
jgi:hypothetical protein